MKVKFDTQLFVDGSIQATAQVIKGAREGMEDAMKRFKSDALDASPSCPELSGSLRDAHHISVYENSSGFVGELRVDGIPYAASLHEGISRWGSPYLKWTRPGSGPHWISSKLITYRADYDRAIRSGLSKALRSIKGIFRWRR